MARELFSAFDDDGYKLALEDGDGRDPATLTIYTDSGRDVSFYPSRQVALDLAEELTKWANR